MPYGLALTETVDVLEVLILFLFLGATALAAFNATDAWKNELVAIDHGDPDVALLGLEDLARADRLVAETAAAVSLGRRLEASVAAVQVAVEANREATAEAGAKASAAYEVANTVNEKIASLGERQVALTERQDADRAEDRAVGEALTETTEAIRTDTEEIKATTAETRDAVRGNGQ